ncbi:hypothetical protein [Desulfacinum hydrothermale]|uniref:hypothetical protein n=1 Tax=Desulfacinum hydrothermale TaxID=109258 RepID=UPI001BAF02A8|nr:hypothetical protein [Desulfacinum hydrothermale]
MVPFSAGRAISQTLLLKIAWDMGITVDELLQRDGGRVNKPLQPSGFAGGWATIRSAKERI